MEMSKTTEPLIDLPSSPNFNIDKKCAILQSQANIRSNTVANDANLLIVFGDDFTFSNSFFSYRKLEKLINYCNEHQTSNMHLMMSTPNRFLDAIKNETNVKWPIIRHDFFPYYSDDNLYWTGYFTSRPTFKKYIKDMSNLYHA
jgi:hypothetical protein